MLLEDFSATYEQAFKGLPLTLPPKTTSFKEWAEEINQHAAHTQSQWFKKERHYWKKMGAQKITPLPKDMECKENKLKHSENVTVTLSKEATGRLLKKVNRAYNTGINDILLTALGAGKLRYFFAPGNRL
ncbi:MAG: hypothetical protein GY757_41555 [bacterium]|nr:hypothetical protein [bacterium]